MDKGHKMRNQYTVEFKIKVAKEYVPNRIGAFVLAKRYGVAVQSVQAWVKQYNEGILETNNAIAVSRSGKPIGRAESILKEIRELTTRIDVLKKQLLAAI